MENWNCLYFSGSNLYSSVVFLIVHNKLSSNIMTTEIPHYENIKKRIKLINKATK